MSNVNLKKYRCNKNEKIFFLEEDFVGWYLIVYENENLETSTKDYLFDSLEDALFEAEDRFDIKKDDWQEEHVE